jgi:hypothetical protein
MNAGQTPPFIYNAVDHIPDRETEMRFTRAWKKKAKAIPRSILMTKNTPDIQHKKAKEGLEEMECQRSPLAPLENPKLEKYLGSQETSKCVLLIWELDEKDIIPVTQVRQCGRRHESTRSTKFDTSRYYSIDLYRFMPIVYLLFLQIIS